ncbi:hypothetical protein ACJMK2_036821 [Sinanodonta woodiana]|uniref:Arsenite methyltransferase n=1 Tax=Sinanodonta woodiana TaxID=1069815 RepID=A0ABD3WIR5_SINWO
MDFGQSVVSFKTFLEQIKPEHVTTFLHWVRETADDYLQNIAETDTGNADTMLHSIQEDLRNSLPMNAISPTETIYIPTSGPNADCDPNKAVHIDAFLFDDEIIDELCEKGQMSRNYCTECGSHNTKALTFLSHSASANQIKYIFTYLLSDLTGKTVMDVGSRTGAVLYGAYVYSQASSIVGVEMDGSFCQLQNNIVQKYKMEDRVKVIQSDIQQQAELLQNCNVVVLNNVFEFFMPVEEQLKIWKFLRQTLCKKDTLIVAVPSLKNSLDSIQSDISVHHWVKEVDIQDKLRLGNIALYKTSEESDLEAIHLYQVL